VIFDLDSLDEPSQWDAPTTITYDGRSKPSSRIAISHQVGATQDVLSFELRLEMAKSVRFLLFSLLSSVLGVVTLVVAQNYTHLRGNRSSPMNTILYVALAHGDRASGYRARFPDLPECSAAGADPAELIASARATVSARLQALADAGEEWPAATAVEHVQAQPPEFALLVDVEVEDTPVRVNISLGEQLLRRLDTAAAANGATRSGFIAQAVRAQLGERRTATPDFEGAARRLQDELSAVGRRINDSLGPESAFSRSMADFDDRVSETIRKAADSVSAAMARRREAEARGATKPEDAAAQI
jgi:predicted RNase H-like HicB family nuclease